MATGQGTQGISSGDYRMNQGALRILYSLIKDTVPSLDDSGLLQSNPVNGIYADWENGDPTTTDMLPANAKRGVLGGSVAFLRGDMTVSGAPSVGSTQTFDGAPFAVPVGLFINDAVGNAFENTPGVASGKAPFIRGGVIGTKLYETYGNLYDGYSGELTYHAGDRLYASINGLLTNQIWDSYEYAWFDSNDRTEAQENDLSDEAMVTVVGIVLAAPSTTNSELYVALKF